MIEKNNQSTQKVNGSAVSSVIKISKEKIAKSISGLEFVGYNENLSNKERNIISTALKNNPEYRFLVKNRVLLFRHAETKVNSLYKNKAAEVAAGTDDKVRSKIDELMKIGVNKENLYLIGDGQTERIIGTMIPTDEGFGGLSIERIAFDKRIDTSVKIGESVDSQNYNDREEVFKASNSIGNFVGELKRKLKQVSNTNVICVVHKVNVPAMLLCFNGGFDRTIELNFKQMSELDLLEFDMLKDGKFINYLKSKSNLFLKLEGNEEILEILGSIDLLKSSISRFNNQELQIRELQNIINAYFSNNIGLYSKFLTSKNQELAVFSFANLLRLGKFEEIKINILELSKNQELIETLEQILAEENKKQRKDKEYIIYLYKVKSEFDFYVYINDYFETDIKSTIDEVKQKSLDPRVREGQDIQPEFNFDSKEYENIINLISRGKKINYIEANAGSGKSFLLANLNEKLAKTGFEIQGTKYIPVYINLSGIKRIQDLEKIFEENSKKSGVWADYKKVYILDSLDEANLYEREIEELGRLMLKQKAKFIVTCRPGLVPNYYNDLKSRMDRENNTEIISLEEFNIQQVDSFAAKYFANNQERITRFNEFRQKGWLNGIDQNPLNLTMICEVIDNDKKIKKMLEIGVLESDDINCTVGLFEIIVNLRLFDWNQSAAKREIDTKHEIEEFENENIKEIIEGRKEVLKIVALESMNMKKNLEKEDVWKIVFGKFTDEQKQRYGNVDFKRFVSNSLDCLNLIFKHSQSGEMRFVHERFRDFFYFKNLEKDIKDGKCIEKEFWEKYFIDKDYLKDIRVNSEIFSEYEESRKDTFMKDKENILNKQDNFYRTDLKKLNCLSILPNNQLKEILRSYIKIFGKNKCIGDYNPIRILFIFLDKIGFEFGIQIINENFQHIDKNLSHGTDLLGYRLRAIEYYKLKDKDELIKCFYEGFKIFDYYGNTISEFELSRERIKICRESGIESDDWVSIPDDAYSYYAEKFNEVVCDVFDEGYFLKRNFSRVFDLIDAALKDDACKDKEKLSYLFEIHFDEICHILYINDQKNSLFQLLDQAIEVGRWSTSFFSILKAEYLLKYKDYKEAIQYLVIAENEIFNGNYSYSFAKQFVLLRRICLIITEIGAIYIESGLMEILNYEYTDYKYTDIDNLMKILVDISTKFQHQGALIDLYISGDLYGLLCSGQIFRQLGEFKQAIRIFDLCLDLSPNNSYIIENVARFYYEIGNYEKSLEYYNKLGELLREDGFNFILFQGLVKVCYALKNYQVVIDIYTKGRYLEKIKSGTSTYDYVNELFSLYILSKAKLGMKEEVYEDAKELINRDSKYVDFFFRESVFEEYLKEDEFRKILSIQ